MEGVHGGDSSPAIDRYRVDMRAVDEIRQKEYDKLCSEGRWSSPFAFITEERLRRSEWGSFTAQQIYIRDFLVARGSDENNNRRVAEEATAKFAYVYRPGEVRLCTHPGDLEEMTESDDEGLRAQSTAGFYDHSSRLNWRHSLVELPRHQKERERFKAVVEMKKFCLALVDERTKEELDYFLSLPAQARHSIAQTKPVTWRVFEEAPGRSASPPSTTASSDLSVTGDEESAGERTLPSPRPSLGYESSATDDDPDRQEGQLIHTCGTREDPNRQGGRSINAFGSGEDPDIVGGLSVKKLTNRSQEVITTPSCAATLPNGFEGREEPSFDESDASSQEDHSSANFSVAQGFIRPAGCSRSLISIKRLDRREDGAIQITTRGTGGSGGGGGGGGGGGDGVGISDGDCGGSGGSDCGVGVDVGGGGVGSGSGHGDSGGVGDQAGRISGAVVPQAFSREQGSSDSCGGSVGFGFGLSVGIGGGIGSESAASGILRKRSTPAATFRATDRRAREWANARFAGDNRRRAPAATSRAISRPVGEWVATSPATDGSIDGFSSGCGGGERALPSPRPSDGCESSATDEYSERQGSRSVNTFSIHSQEVVTTPCAFVPPKPSEERESRFDESDSPSQDGHSSMNSSVAEGLAHSAGCPRGLMITEKKIRLGGGGGGAIRVGASGRGSGDGDGDGGGGGGSDEDGGDCAAVRQEVPSEPGPSDSCGGPVGIGGCGGIGGAGGRAASNIIRRSTPAAASRAVGSRVGEWAGARMTRNSIRRSTPAAASRAIARPVGEWVATSLATDGSSTGGFSGGCKSSDNHSNALKPDFHQKSCNFTSMWTSQQQDYNVPNALPVNFLPVHQDGASFASERMSVGGAGNSYKDESACVVSRRLASTYLMSTTTSDSNGGGGNGGGSEGCNSRTTVEESVSRRSRSHRSLVDTVPTDRGHRRRTRRALSQSQAKSALSDSSSSAGVNVSIRARCTSTRTRSGRSGTGDENKGSSRKKISALISRNGGSSTGHSDCEAEVKNDRAGTTHGCTANVGVSTGTNDGVLDIAVVVSPRTTDNVVPRINTPAATNDSACRSDSSQVYDSVACSSGASQILSGDGDQVNDTTRSSGSSEIGHNACSSASSQMNDISCSSSSSDPKAPRGQQRRTYSCRSSEQSRDLGSACSSSGGSQINNIASGGSGGGSQVNDSACSSGGSQVGDSNGITRLSLPVSDTLATNGNNARTWMSQADHHLVLGSSESGDDDGSKEERHLHEENTDKRGNARTLCDGHRKNGLLPTTAVFGNMRDYFQPAPCLPEQVAIPGELPLREKVSAQSVAKGPKQIDATKTESELRQYREAEPRQYSSRELPLPRPKVLLGAPETKLRPCSKESLLPRPEALPRASGPELRQPSEESPLPSPEALPRASESSRANARKPRYAAVTSVAENALKEAIETIEANNALVKLARHQCAAVEAKSAETAKANALLRNYLAQVQVRAARNQRLPATEDPRLCTRVRGVDIGDMSTATLLRDDPPTRERRVTQEDETSEAPAVQHSCLFALAGSAHDNGKDSAESVAKTGINKDARKHIQQGKTRAAEAAGPTGQLDAKITGERAKVTSEFAASSSSVLPTHLPPRHHAEETSSAGARPTAEVAHQESNNSRKTEARAVLEGSSVQTPDAKEKEKDAVVVASDCQNTHHLEREDLEENARSFAGARPKDARSRRSEERVRRTSDAGIKSVQASIVAEFASIRLHLSQQYAGQLAMAARESVRTADAMGSLARRVSVLEEWKDNRLRIECSNARECHVETTHRIAAMRSRNSLRMARLEAFKMVAAKTNAPRE